MKKERMFVVVVVLLVLGLLLWWWMSPTPSKKQVTPKEKPSKVVKVRDEGRAVMPRKRSGWFGWLRRRVAPKRRKKRVRETAKIGTPVIDLRAVEKAIWETKAKKPGDMKDWLTRFEDELSAIYFTTRKRLRPEAMPVSWLTTPVSVQLSWEKEQLRMFGYLNKNGVAGYQSGDTLLFVFKQSGAYDMNSRAVRYELHDSSGYYYRQPREMFSAPSIFVPAFLGFFTNKAWRGKWSRTTYKWHGAPMWWSAEPFRSRAAYYDAMYPLFMAHYRMTYFTHYRPKGWAKGSPFERGLDGQYYPKRRHRPRPPKR